MAEQKSSTPWVIICVFTISLSLGLYFTFAAVQGDFGILRRAEINHDIQKLQAELTSLNGSRTFGPTGQRYSRIR